jgi:hypothetical protein
MHLMNKHLPVLIVLLGFGLVGCVSNSNNGSVSIFFYECSSQISSCSKVSSYKDMISNYRAEAMDINTGEKFYYGQQQDDDGDGVMSLNLKNRIVKICEQHGTVSYWGKKLSEPNQCVLTRYNQKIFYKDLDDYNLYVAKQKQNEKERKSRLIASQEKQKEQKLNELIVRCKGFGFTGESNIAACVQREVQHDLELAQQEQRLQQLENRIASASKPSNDKPFFLEVLSILAEEAERQDELAQRVRLYELESEVSSLRSSKNVKQATCSLNRNC